MPDFKVTWFFDGSQRTTGIGGSSFTGWTETWYCTSADMDTLLEGITAAGAQFLALRTSILPDQYVISWVRASAVDNPRISKVANVQRGGAIPAAAFPPAQITCCLLVDFTVLPGVVGDVAHHRRFLLRGLPADVINGNVINGGSVLWNRFRQFLRYIGNRELPEANPAFTGFWKIRCQGNPVVDANILTLVPNALNPNAIDITATAPPGAVGQQVVINKVKFPRGVNRLWTIYAINGGVYTLVKSRFPISGAFQLPGQVRRLTHGIAAPSQYLIVGLREHKIGPPSRPTRGRRRAV